MILLKEIREEKKLTQMQLSQLSGVRQSLISEIENGKTCSPRLDTAKKLANALGCTVDDLIDEE